nr:c-type cytochrome [Pseudomonas sp. MWU13-2105]
MLSACGDEHHKNLTHSASVDAMPGDKALARIYETSCKLCHSNPASGAPLTGDAQAWLPRVAQGSDTLLDHMINGHKGMPPMGLCMQCSEEQFLGLAAFMSGQKI